MTEAMVTRKRRGEIVRGIFQLLLNEPAGLPVKILLERLRAVVPPAGDEDTFYPNYPDVRRYGKHSPLKRS